jgi:hypothetical protein
MHSVHGKVTVVAVSLLDLEPTPGTRSNIMQEHVKYFVNDPDAIFLCVQDILFSVPKSRLTRHMEFFKDLLSLPQHESSTEGRRADNPIYMHGVHIKHFKAMLRMIDVIEGRSNINVSMIDDWPMYMAAAARWDTVALTA